MRRRLALAVAVATAGCGSPVEPTAQVLAPAQAVTREAADPTAGLAELTVTTPTTAAPPVTAARPRRRVSRSAAPPSTRTPGVEGGSGATRTVSSTAYCLTGTMANGQRVYRGAAAMNGVPLGSRWRILETGATYVIADRIGHGSGFDIAMPGDCNGARAYGRRTVTVERIA